MTDTRTLAALRDCAVEAAQAAAAVIRAEYDQPHQVYAKGKGDLVTDTDRTAQEAALGLIRARFPEHSILAEEDPSNHRLENGRWVLPAGVCWAVDPVDGTTNYTVGLPFICVSVGVAIDGKPAAGAIIDPLRDELFAAARGMGATLNGQPLPALKATRLEDAVVCHDWSRSVERRQAMLRALETLSARAISVRALGSAALSLAYVAAARVQLYLNYGLSPWDVTAAAALIGEVGGGFAAVDGGPWQLGMPGIITGHPALIDEVLGRST